MAFRAFCWSLFLDSAGAENAIPATTRVAIKVLDIFKNLLLILLFLCPSCPSCPSLSVSIVRRGELVIVPYLFFRG